MSVDGKRLLRYLVIILLGNGLYYSLYPHLPPGARHQPFQIDWGIAVDFWFCLMVYGVLELAKFLQSKGKK
jgi:hypothetical protein